MSRTMADCRTCKYNSYANIHTAWVSCAHPVTLTKKPRPASGDPIWIDLMTSDVPVMRIGELADCPAHEPAIVRDAAST